MPIPQFLEEMLQKQYDNEITNKIIEGYKEQRNVTLRINTIKTTKEKIKECLNQAKIEFQEVEWNRDALIIKHSREEEIRKLSLYYKELDCKTKNCLQKVGIYRYNAYKDTGSDLSFAVCLLDEKNDGVVFNGIYSRDMSNIYAKPIENGMSKYKVTPEEQEAINRAMA